MVLQTDLDSKRPNDQGRYMSKSAEQSSEPGRGLKTVTLPVTIGSTTVEMSKQQANVAQRLADIVLLSRSWINRRWCLRLQKQVSSRSPMHLKMPLLARISSSYSAMR